MLKRNLETQDKLFTVIESNRKSCQERIEKNDEEAKLDRERMKKEHTNLLDTHYVTTGQLNTLEERLIGQIKILASAIEHLTSSIDKLSKG